MKIVVSATLLLMGISNARACDVYSNLAKLPQWKEAIEKNGNKVVDEIENAQLIITSTIRNRNGYLANHTYNELHLKGKDLNTIKTVKVWSCTSPKDTECRPIGTNEDYHKMVRKKLNKLTKDIAKFCEE